MTETTAQTTSPTFTVADRCGNYGAPMESATAPGTGDITFPCGNHRAHCRFGRPHTWVTWYHQGHVVRTQSTYACEWCGAVCTADENT